jgi:hypothetical protein
LPRQLCAFVGWVCGLLLGGGDFGGSQ